MAAQLPNTFEDITLDWFRSTVASSVTSIHVEPLDPSKGLIGDLARVHAQHDTSTGPASYIVKLPAANPGSREIGMMLNAYGREVLFYQQLAPRLARLQLPTCYYAAADAPSQRWVVVLQDCPADEFDFLAGATQLQAEAAVDALAEFHASGWQRPPIEWMPGFDAGGVCGLQPLWLKNLPAFLERYNDVIPGETGQWVTRFAPHLADWSTHAATEPLTIVHADYRLDNLLFNDGSVTMIDWQTAMRAPAAMDLSCFISTSLTVPNRRNVEDHLIARYLARLNGAGITVGHEWFRRSYNENLLWWMGQFANNLAHLAPGDDRVQTALTAMVERVYTAAADRDVGRLLTGE